MSMTVGLFDAKTRLSELVEQVANGGDDILITRRGKAVARLVPIDESSEVERSLALLLAARESSKAGSGSLRELIDEGRRL
jgi:prevent-host-death family protein